MPGTQRNAAYNDVSKNAGDEMAALAWSWAALVYLNLPPKSYSSQWVQRPVRLADRYF